MQKLKFEQIGTKHFKGTVDITDPCYDKDVWCRTTADVKDGEYCCAVWTEKTANCGKRVRIIGIYLNSQIPAETDMEEIGEIGVDAGLAGFFMNKPDYTDEEWEAFCDALNTGIAWLNDEGFFSYSGYGDGCYSVYAHKDANGDIDALEIKF